MTSKSWTRVIPAGALVLCAAMAAAQTPPAVPAHPRDLTYPPLTFTPPDPAAHRHVLGNGVVAFMVEDHELPLVTVGVQIYGGAYLDPKGKEGLASLAGSQMRAGGTETHTAEAFDEEADFLAASISSGFGDTRGSASSNFLAKDTDKALALLFEMLRQPRFQQDRLDLAKRQALQAMERRNDSTASIENREWGHLVRGKAHFSTAAATRASIESLTREDLLSFHREVVHPGNFVITVAGDFDTAAMKAKLESAMAGWKAGPRAAAVPKPEFTPAPGLYLVDKPDVNQGRVTLGHLGIQRGHPDEIAIDLMNDILGGSGFTSRIVNRIRSDEGLAYSAGSSFAPGIYYDGVFLVRFQSKSESVARAVQIALDEIARIRTQPVSDEELESVRNSAIETFPRRYQSAGAKVQAFADDEMTGRDPAFWQTYRDRVRAVTVADIQRVAREHLAPDRLVILAVGDTGAMLKGDADRPEFSLETIAGGRVTRIPLPDPMTMVYPDAK